MRTARQAAAYFLAKRTNEPGMCLKETRLAYEIPSRFPSAAVAWRYALGKHHGDMTPPYGAPVFYSGGSQGYGHIAIYVGNGLVRSTDAGGRGAMGTAPLRWFYEHWNLPYEGWAEGFNSVRIVGLDEGAPPTSSIKLSDLKYGTMNSPSVVALQRKLNVHFNLAIPRTGNYLDQTDYAVRQCQRRHGFGSDQVHESYVGPRQAHHLGLV